MVQSPSNSRQETAYALAQAHSKRVRFFKRVLPLIACVALVAIIGAMATSRMVDDIGVQANVSGSAINDGKLVMASPKLDGFTKDNRAYTITAARAIQDLAGNDTMLLEEFRADIEMAGGVNAVLESPTGIYNSGSEQLVFDQQAILTTSDGMQITMGQADIDAQSGRVDAKGNVIVTSEATNITADTMQVIDGGNKIVFDKNVRLVMQPDAVPSQSSQSQSIQSQTQQ